ncbi:adenylate kinase [Allobranchiibius sp. CTAmp26]|nr:adenylate kinase [Allobranchiibius sp. CTAmp26]
MTTDPSAACRILIYGVTGSGKSTAAKRIAARTGLPVTLVDELTWMPGWVPVAEDQQRYLIAEIASKDRWVLDTAYGAWLDLVVPRAQLIIALNYPRWFSLQRLLRRTLLRAIDQQTICNGNTQSWRGLYGKHSIVRWHFKSFARKRDRIRAWADAVEGPPVLFIRRPRDLESCLPLFVER